MKQTHNAFCHTLPPLAPGLGIARMLRGNAKLSSGRGWPKEVWLPYSLLYKCKIIPAGREEMVLGKSQLILEQRLPSSIAKTSPCLEWQDWKGFSFQKNEGGTMSMDAIDAHQTGGQQNCLLCSFLFSQPLPCPFTNTLQLCSSTRTFPASPILWHKVQSIF